MNYLLLVASLTCNLTVEITCADSSTYTKKTKLSFKTYLIERELKNLRFLTDLKIVKERFLIIVNKFITQWFDCFFLTECCLISLFKICRFHLWSTKILTCLFFLHKNIQYKNKWSVEIHPRREYKKRCYNCPRFDAKFYTTTSQTHFFFIRKFKIHLKIKSLINQYIHFKICKKKKLKRPNTLSW